MNKIEELYDTYDEENRLLRSREAKIESETTIKYLSPYVKKTTSILEVGCGTGYYALFFKDKFKNYTGIDLSKRNVKVFQKAIKDTQSENIVAKVGNALKLEEESNKYDLVLNLGPLYHLGGENGKKCIEESIRVCKKGGIVAFSYMNKFGNFVKLCAQENFIGRYPDRKLFKNMLQKNTDDDGIFFFTTPEEIEGKLKSAGLEIVKHLSTDGVVMHHHRISDYNEAEFQIWKEFHFLTCEEPSIRGLGDHGLVICKKK